MNTYVGGNPPHLRANTRQADSHARTYPDVDRDHRTDHDHASTAILRVIAAQMTTAGTTAHSSHSGCTATLGVGCLTSTE